MNATGYAHQQGLDLGDDFRPRGFDRSVDDYQSPLATVDAILPHIEFLQGDTVLEPCRGDGNIYNRIPELIRHSGRGLYCEIREGSDYLLWTPPGPLDVIWTNPPFSLALEFLEKSLQEAETVIYLLRLSFLGTQGRKQFWNVNPPTHIFVLSERPIFVWVCKARQPCRRKYPVGYDQPCECGAKVGPASDNSEYAWFCFDRGGRIHAPHWLTVL